MDNTIKVLTINTGVEPIKIDKFELSSVDEAHVKTTLVTKLNEMGKSAHILLKFGKRYWIVNHTAARGPSKTYSKEAIDYHPYMKELS